MQVNRHATAKCTISTLKGVQNPHKYASDTKNDNGRLLVTGRLCEHTRRRLRHAEEGLTPTSVPAYSSTCAASLHAARIFSNPCSPPSRFTSPLTPTPLVGMRLTIIAVLHHVFSRLDIYIFPKSIICNALRHSVL